MYIVVPDSKELWTMKSIYCTSKNGLVLFLFIILFALLLVYYENKWTIAPNLLKITTTQRLVQLMK